MKFKFTKKSINAINKWLAKYGFDTECVLVRGDGDLEYNSDENEIYIPRVYDFDTEGYDSWFMKFLRGIGLTADFDAVTLSILHELGHAQTTDLFGTKEWNWCAAQKVIWAGIHDGPSEEYMFGYWNFEDELAANNWLILYTKSFPQKVQNLEDILEQTVKFG